MIYIGNLQINKMCLGDVEVTKAYLGDVEVYGSKQQPEGKYMTITVSDGASGTVISPTVTGTLSPNLQYRINRNGDWNDFIVGTTADIHLVSGDWVQFKGNNTSGISTSQNDYLNFAISGNPVSLSGNIMSLIDGVGDALLIPRDYCFFSLFKGSSIKTVSSDFLPATTLTSYCYRYMFSGCNALTTAPELPATTLADSCYWSMFENCSSLVTAPSLPATTLADFCYIFMFYNCKALTTAPELPAKTLSSSCYQNMFLGCSNLNYVKSLATNITATNALNQWLSGVASSGTFVKPIGVGYPTGDSGIPNGWTVVEEKPKPEGKYMTITVLDGDAGTTIAPTVTGTLSPNLQYRINNNGDWTNFIVGTTADIHLTAGDWVQFKGVNENGVSVDSSNYLNFAISGNPVALSGNVMSLIDGVGDVEVIPCSYCFLNLFKDTKIKTVTKDFLPATTLTGGCYSGMFQGCTSLTAAPALTATTLADYCYSGIFSGCTSLETAPALPATMIAPNCYRSMFQGCTSLAKAPELPVTTLANYCYNNMFYGCTSLTTAPALPATTLAEYCYYSMFYGCTSLVNAPELPATTLANYCYQSMFSGCTSLTTAPVLPATTLASNCYQDMFRNCTALTQAPELPATNLKGNCYNAMFSGCTSLTTAPVLPATMLMLNCYQNMFRNCSNLSYVKCLATRITSIYIRNWLDGVASSGTFVKPAGVSYPSGVIPSGWTIEEI